MNKELLRKKTSMKNTKEGKNKGITLIALIITIIVMMILVGVTVTFTIGENGILNSAKEAKIKTELAQIKDCVAIEKAAIIAANKGEIPSSYNTETLQQSIPEYLKEKYIESGIIKVEPNGELYYDSEKVDNKESDKFKELGINSAPVVQFREFVQSKIATVDQVGNYKNLDQLQKQVKQKYPRSMYRFVY